MMSYKSYDTAVQPDRMPTCPAHIDITYTVANEVPNTDNFNETLTSMKTYAIPFIEIMEQAAKTNDKFV